MTETKLRQTDVLDRHRMSPHYNPGYNMEHAADMSGFVKAAGHVGRVAAVGLAIVAGGEMMQHDATPVQAAEVPGHVMEHGNIVQQPLDATVHINELGK